MEANLKNTLEKYFLPYEKNQETEELFDSLLSDLSDSMQEKMDEGLTPEQALQETIENLGDLDELLQAITQSSTSERIEPLVMNQDGKRNFHLFQTKLVNTLEVSLNNIEEIAVSYSNAGVKIFPTEGENLKILEYMNVDRPDLYGVLEQKDQRISVFQGRSDTLILFFNMRTEIYLPESFIGKLILENRSGSLFLKNITGLQQIIGESSSGSVKFEQLESHHIALSARSGSVKGNGFIGSEAVFQSASGSVKLDDIKVKKQLQVSAKSGSVKLFSVQAPILLAESASGSVKAENISGSDVTFTSRSGGVNVENAVVRNSGQFSSRAGSVNVKFQEVQGDITAEARSGWVQLTMPTKASYTLQTFSKNGSVTLPIGTIGETPAGQPKVKIGTVGQNPQFHLKAESSSGSIRIN
ncbi:DUF4097 family beta strand repeat-containing protein [Enterococcus timonensis]|uniref:DUF4097 family beta strand repeat-containing protein n=1 Tax=Enterococcus timonensis TaxID=1852364 RepID=UPI0008DB209C|nr:DUF4097 family beta strand repeat-containing protein [Enterococcus timonensis]